MVVDLKEMKGWEKRMEREKQWMRSELGRRVRKMEGLMERKWEVMDIEKKKNVKKKKKKEKNLMLAKD